MMTVQTQSQGRRIGIVTYDFDPAIGGLGVLVKTYLEEQKKLFPADTYTVISPSKNADQHSSFLAQARYRKPGGCPVFSFSLFFTLEKIIQKYRLDLIHVHSGSGGVFLLRKPSRKLIVTAHHTYRQEADLVFARSPIKRFWKLGMALLESRTYRLADAVICVSRDTANEIIAQYAVPASRVSVIENPVRVPDTASLSRLPKHQNSVLFVGRLEPRKGILLLLKAFQILKKEMPSASLRLIGTNLMGNGLMSVITKRGLTDSVTILGHVHDPYRFRETTQATIIVVPSLLEGFGLVAAESMVLGTCVIASNAPGLRSVITDGRTGLSFPARDPEGCAAAMKKALSDSSLRASLEHQARTEALERFNIEKRTRDLGEMYDRLLIQ